MKIYNPLDHSIVQACNGDPMAQYEATDFHEALLFAIAKEIGRVHNNRYQGDDTEIYEDRWDHWSGNPYIPGIHWRAYSFDCDCPDDGGMGKEHRPDCEDLTPNFQFEDVEFYWYKYPGRGMSVNKDMPAQQWVEWFDRCLAKIREFDRIDLGGDGGELVPIPEDALAAIKQREHHE